MLAIMLLIIYGPLRRIWRNKLAEQLIIKRSFDLLRKGLHTHARISSCSARDSTCPWFETALKEKPRLLTQQENGKINGNLPNSIKLVYSRSLTNNDLLSRVKSNHWTRVVIPFSIVKVSEQRDQQLKKAVFWVNAARAVKAIRKESKSFEKHLEAKRLGM